MAPALLLLAFLAGALLAAQGPILNRLALHAGGPLQAAAVAFATGLGVLALLILVTGGPPPRLRALVAMPPWLWLSGLIGTGLLALTLVAVPRVGVAAFAGAMLCGQILAALAWDHWGLLGLAERPLDAARALGAVLMIAGLGLVLGGSR